MVTISKYYSSVTKKGVKPSNPGNVVTEIPEVLNPPDSPVNHSPVTIGSPANGLSLVGQELSLGLASSGVTGALSGTDWSTFNGKLGGTIASGQVAFGTGVNTVGGDSGFLYDTSVNRINILDTALVNSHGFQSVSGRLVFYRPNSSVDSVSFGGGNAELYIRGGIGRFFHSGTVLSIQNTSINGDLNINLNGTGKVGIQTALPTALLDVNGTVRIRSISNAVGNFLTTSATGVVQQRTAGETLGDIGALSSSAISIASGQVAFGTGVNTVGGSNGLTLVATTNTELTIKGITGQAHLILRDSTLASFFSILTNASRSFFTASGSVNFRAQASGSIIFQTTNSNTTAWTISNDGTLEGNGAKIIGTNTGNLTLGSYGGNGHILLTPNGTGGVGIGTTPTNTLDINGTTRIRTISNAVGNFLTTSATGVVQQRTAGEVATDIGAVTITGTQTITGAKTFSNGLLVLSGTSATFRIASNNNLATLNFRANDANEKATLEFSDATNIFSIATRVNNSDISITPHGTGKIKLSNVPSGTGDVLMRDASNNLVVSGSTFVEQTTGTFTPTMSAVSGGITYTFTVMNANYIKVGKIVHFSIALTEITSTGTPIGLLRIGGLPFTSAIADGRFWYVGVIQFFNSSFSAADVDVLRGAVGQNASTFTISKKSSTITAPTFASNGILNFSGFYETD
jgi:hypothetical protein